MPAAYICQKLTHFPPSPYREEGLNDKRLFVQHEPLGPKRTNDDDGDPLLNRL